MPEKSAGAEVSEASAQICFPPPRREVERIYGDISFPEAHPRNHALPYVVMNMVSSVDGRTSSGGKSGSIGGGVDRRTMRTLRSKVDAVAVGAGTMRAEKVSLTSEGLRVPEPKAVIITASLDFPPENMASLGEQETIILTSEDRAARSQFAKLAKSDSVEILPVKANPGGRIDLVSALEILKQERGVDRLLLEGGPSISAEMASLGVVSEIFVTVAPKLLGGDPGQSAGILPGHLPESSPRALSLAQIHASTPGGEVFLRYGLAES